MNSKMILVIPIKYLPGNKFVYIRELCGKDEQSVAGSQSIDAISLLDRILQGDTGNTNLISRAALLPVSDRDRILTAVYMNTYGFKVDASISCPSCTKPFDISFSLHEWANEISNDKVKLLNGKMSDFPFNTQNGIRFRLPTGEDEMAIMGMEPKNAEMELLKRCLPRDIKEFDANTIQQEMLEVAPLADSELEAECPECAGKQLLHFNQQQYLLTSLIKEREKLVSEVHLLTKYYGWGLNEILELPRKIRRLYLTMMGNL
jgi:hypothetical protein